MEKAMADLRLYDLAIDLHGSRALGIAQRKSNVDVLITRPLESLLKELLHEEDDARFTHAGSEPCGPPWYLPQKLMLQHVATSVRLDLISRWSADIFVRERDAVARVCLEKDERVHPFLELVAKWYYARRACMPPEEGYPTAYCFRLFALHYLMSRSEKGVGVVLPPLTTFGSFLNEKDEKYIYLTKDTATVADDLAVEFLENLGRLSKEGQGLWADLRKPDETGPPTEWQAIDPPSHKKMLHLTAAQIADIGKMAGMDGKALRLNKGALDKPLSSTS